VRLTAKFLLAFASTSLIVLALSAFIRFEREIAHFDADSRRDLGAFAASLAHAVASVASGVGSEAAARVIDRASEKAPHLRVRWVSLSSVRGGLLLPSAPAADLEPLERDEVAFSVLDPTADQPGALIAYARVDADQLRSR
jgi:hypothetical protein